jgi:hypothetical protein
VSFANITCWSHWLNVPVFLGLILSGVCTYWASPAYPHKPDPFTGSADFRMPCGEADGAPREGKPLLDFSDWAAD